MLPAGEVARDGFSAAVGQWVMNLARAIRGSRLYSDNNAMFRGFVDVAHRELTELLAQRPDVTLLVADDRLLFAGDVVHHSTDRVDGLPATLFQSGLRKLQFRRGMPRGELALLIRAMGADYSSARASGEDLLTNLWRIAAPHLEYTSARVLTRAAASAGSRATEASAQAIVAALSASPPLREDIRGFLAGTTDEIIAFERLYGVSGAEVDLLRLSALFNQASTHPLEREDFVRELERQDQSTELTIRLFERLLAATVDERGTDDAPSTPVLLNLLDALLDGGHFVSLTPLVSRLVEYDRPQARAQDPQRAQIARHLAPQLVGGERMRRILEAYSTAMAQEEEGGPRAAAILALIGACGSFGIAPILDHLGVVSRSPWRRAILSLVTAHEIPTAAALQQRMATAQHWSLICDLLSLSPLLPPEQATPLALRAARHPDAHVRAEGLRLLLAYEDPQLEPLVVQRLRDPDRDVRMEALALAAREKGDVITEAMDAAMADDDFVARDQDELRVWCTTITSLLGFRAIPALSRLLQPTLLSRLKPPIEANVIAIECLGTIDHPAARAQLTKALRSLNKTIRTAAKRAIERSELIGFSVPTPLVPDESTLAIAPQPHARRTAPPAAFEDEVRDVLSSLFGEDERAPDPGDRAAAPPQRPTPVWPSGKPPAALPAPEGMRFEEVEDYIDAEILGEAPPRRRRDRPGDDG